MPKLDLNDKGISVAGEFNTDKIKGKLTVSDLWVTRMKSSFKSSIKRADSSADLKGTFSYQFGDGTGEVGIYLKDNVPKLNINGSIKLSGVPGIFVGGDVLCTLPDGVNEPSLDSIQVGFSQINKYFDIAGILKATRQGKLFDPTGHYLLAYKHSENTRIAADLSFGGNPKYSSIGMTLLLGGEHKFDDGGKLKAKINSGTGDLGLSYSWKVDKTLITFATKCNVLTKESQAPVIGIGFEYSP